jgi:hypothetical protein
MAENELYSAYHWAKKAEKIVERAKEISEALDVVDITQCLRRSGEEVFQDGTFTIKGDNHPLVIEGMAGTTATGLQVKDSLGAGETDLEHYATGDRYGSRLVNRTYTGAEGTLDLYTTTAGVSILDATDLSSVLVPTPDTGDSSNRAASTSFVTNALQAKANADGSNITTTLKTAIASWSAVDFSSVVSLGSPYTTTKAGWIRFYGFANNNSQYLKINGTEIVRTWGSAGEYNDSVHLQMIVPAGTKLEFIGSCYFYSLIGG